jgi:hypothetical protein
VSIRLLNRHTRNPSRSCISCSTSQSHSLSDSISQCASLFTYHLVRTGYSPVSSSRFTLITQKTLDSSPTDYDSSGLGSEHRTVTSVELATDPTQLTSSRTCHRHVTKLTACSLSRMPLSRSCSWSQSLSLSWSPWSNVGSCRGLPMKGSEYSRAGPAVGVGRPNQHCSSTVLVNSGSRCKHCGSNVC